jgi:hypothetical protein
MPFLFNLVNTFHGKNILLIYNSANKSIVDELNFGKGVKCIPLNIHRYVHEIKYRWKFNLNLSSFYIDIVINPIRSRSGPIDDSVAKAITSDCKITASSDFINASKVSSYFITKWYSKIIKIDPGAVHEYDYNLSFFESLGYKFDVEISYTKFLKINNLTPQIGDYFVVQPFSSNVKRNWPIENYVKLIDYITSNYNYKVVIVGSQADKTNSNELVSRLSGGEYLNLTATIDLSSFLSIINLAKFAFSNDSSGAHACALLNTHCFAVVGLGQPGRFFPYPSKINNSYIKTISNSKYRYCSGCEWKCTVKHDNSMAFPCVQEISVDEVLDQVKMFLSKEFQ